MWYRGVGVMNKTVLQFRRLLAFILLVGWLAGTLVACGGGSPETPPGGPSGGNNQTPDPGNNPDPGGGTDEGSDNSSPPITTDPRPLINDIQDFPVSGPGRVRVNAGGQIRATKFQWEQISAGTQYNLLNADERVVEFLVPDFAAVSPQDVRKITLRLTVEDDAGNTAYDDVVVTVPPRLQPPPGNNTPPSIEELPDAIARPGEIVELTASATDLEDGVPSIRWIQITGPLLGLTDQQLNNPTINFIAPANSEKIWFIVQATDSEGEVSQTDVLVEVMGNIPPVANAGGDRAVMPGQLVNLQGNGADSDGRIDGYQWQQLDGPTVDLLNDTTAIVSFTAPVVNIATPITLELTVTDDLGAIASDQVVITVDPALNNIPPSANAGVDQIAVLGGTVTLVASSDDADGTVVSQSWRQLSGPLVTLAGENTNVVTFTMPVDMQGQTAITLEFTVTDDQGATASDEVIITANVPPIANAGTDQLVMSGDTVNLLGSNSSDPDGNISSYNWTYVSGTQVTIENANSSNAWFVAPQIEGSITIRLDVTDNNGAISSDEVIISVSNANIPPTATVNGGITVVSGDPNPVSVTGQGDDTDGTITQYNWSQVAGPLVTLIDADTPTVSFNVPTVLVTSIVTLRLTVVDNEGATGFAEGNVIIEATTSNNSPTANAGTDQIVLVGESVTLSGTGFDADGDPLTYQWVRVGGPAVALNGANLPQATFTAPDVSSISDITFELVVTDDKGASGSDQIIVTVEPLNQAPVADAGPDIVATENEVVTINGSGFDPDGVIASYQWAYLSGVPVTLNNTSSATLTFTAPQVSSSSITTLRLTVTDDQGATAFDDLILTTNPVGGGNTPPVVSVGPDLSVFSGDPVSITGTATDDGTIITHIWTQTGTPALNLQTPTTPTVSFTAPNVGSPTDVTLRLTAVDDLGAIGFDELVVTINPNGSNIAPTANAGPDLSFNSGDTVTVNGGGIDVDGSIVGYQWIQTAGIQVVLTNENTPNVQFAAPNVTVASDITLRLTVTDNLAATGSDEMVVTVNPLTSNNVPPVANAGPDQSVNSFDLVNLVGSGTDSDGSIVGYQWVQTNTNGPTVTLTNANTANASFRVPLINTTTELGFELTVTDNAGDTHTDAMLVTIYPFTQLSGTITTQSGTQVDSDVNDVSASYASNDIAADAQPLFNPVVLGGFVNQPNTGSPGRSQSSGDIDDYYSISLSANQVINLYIGDANTTNDLDLLLWDESGNALVDSSVSPTATVESLIVPATGNYLINVRAIGGASNYVLSVGISNLGAQSNGWRLSDDFEAGDVIVRFRDNFISANVSETLYTRAASVGLQAKAGARGRNMLFGLGNASQKATAFATLGVSRAQANVSTSLPDKWETLLAAKALVKRADVVEAGLNYRYYPTAIPNDTNYNLQWHYPMINLPQAWDTTTGSSNVIVAVIDTGVLLSHPDLQGQLVPGYDFIANNANSGDGEPGIDSNPDDPGDGGGGASSSFHGTHVAGTIAAASNNNTGVAGVAWGVRIMPCRAVGINGGLSYDIEQCVRYVSGLANDSGTVPAQPADIINLSLGGPTNSTTAPSAYRLARQAGVIVVAAAGNDANSGLFAPAAYDGVVSVSATNISRQLASYSNFGSTIDVSAPGGDSGDLNGDGFFDGVLSTGGDDTNGPITFNYRFAAGTSMAAPHMAGVVALMKSVYPGLTPDILDTMLQNGELTDDLGATGRDNNFGYGLINAQKAVLAAANAGAPSPPPPPAAVLQVSPTTLNLGIALTSAQINISNAGGGTLDITNISNDSGGWLTVSPAAVDANGLGNYNVNVNRNSMLDGVYTSTITITSSAGTQSVAVIMQVNSASTSDNAGFHYIELIDMDTMQLFDRVISSGTNGVYEFTFPSVPLGVYHIQAGSDLDKDGVLCETGDACGAYPTLDLISQHVVVDGSSTSLNGLDFTTGFNVNLTNP